MSCHLRRLAPGLVITMVMAATLFWPTGAMAQSKAPAGNAPKAANVTKPGKPEAGALLNLAIRQPMLAERITKSFAAAGQKVLETRTRRQLDDAKREFAVAMKDLQAFAPTAEIKENYELLEQLYTEFRDITGKTINLENATHLAEQNEELVWIATKGAQLMQAHAKSNRSDLIATAGDLRVLTQRIAKLYLFRSWGIRSDLIANDLKKADADYQADMKKLMAAPQNTPQIKSELQLAETQYLFLKQAIDRLNANRTSVVELEHVTKTCDNILEVMERVTKLYEAVKG